MKKIILLCTLLALAMSTAQSARAEANDTGNSIRSTGISYVPRDVQTAVRFDTSDVTIFGLSQVALAVLKMKLESQQMQLAYRHIQQNMPGMPSLRETFENRLNGDLRASGLNLENISVRRSNATADEVTYAITAGEVKSRRIIVLDRLAAIYYAPGPSDAYAPRASVLLSLLDREAASAGASPHFNTRLQSSIKDQGSLVFKDFAALTQKPAEALEGLRQVMIQLADQVAKVLIRAKIQEADNFSDDKPLLR